MSNELQFGYKKGASTVLCTALLKETIDYYTERDSDCYNNNNNNNNSL